MRARAVSAIMVAISSSRENSEGLLEHPSSPLVLRILGTEYDGREIRLLSAKCTIGSGSTCTFRLRAAGVQPLHCLILRGRQAAIIRRWSSGTYLNGGCFTDSPLREGDRISIGPVELEVVSGTEPSAAAAREVDHPCDDSPDLVAALESRIAQLEAELAADEVSAGEAASETADAHQGLVSQQELYRELDRARENLERERQEGETHRHRLEDQLAQAKQQTESLRKQLAEAEDRQRSFSERDVVRQTELAQVRAELDAARRTTHTSGDLKGKLQAAEAEMAKWRDQTDWWRRRAEQIEIESQQIAHSQRQWGDTEVRERLDHEREEFRQQQDQWRQEREQLQKEAEAGAEEVQRQLSQQQEQLQKRDQQAEREAAELQQEREAWELERNRFEAELEARTQQLAEQHEQLQHQREELHSQWESLNAERRQFESQRESESESGVEAEEEAEHVAPPFWPEVARDDVGDGFAVDGEQGEAPPSFESEAIASDEEVRFEAPSADMPVSADDVLSRMGQQPNWDEEKPDPFAVEEDPAESQPQTNTDTPESVEADEEESIEEYMARLLKRVRGDEDSSLSQPVTRANDSSSPEPVAAEPSVESPQQPSFVAELTGESSEFRPRSQPPELSTNLQAMRELANESARTAIDSSARRRGSSAAGGKFLMAAVALVIGVILLFVPSFYAYCGAVVLFIVGILFGVQGIVYARRYLAAVRKQRDLDKARTTTSGAPAGESGSDVSKSSAEEDDVWGNPADHSVRGQTASDGDAQQSK